MGVRGTVGWAQLLAVPAMWELSSHRRLRSLSDPVEVSMLTFLSITLSLAYAAPTPEERALRAVLVGREAEAVRVLGASEDEQTRRVAVMLAIRSGQGGLARRLMPADAPWADWARAELLAVEGDDEAGAAAALARMDRALAGEDRDALAALVIDWAEERVENDVQSAASMARVVLGLDVEAAVHRRAEDMLLGRAELAHEADVVELAARRLAADGDDVAARLVVGQDLMVRAPSRSLALIEPVVDTADLDTAIRAAGLVVQLELPPQVRAAPLARLAERFDDPRVSALRLAFAQQIMARDPDVGDALLTELIADPEVGLDAAEAQVVATRDPAQRRARALELADRLGPSARGERARGLATQALRDTVAAAAEGAERQAAALAALAEDDGAGEPAFLFEATPDDASRSEALWALGERFPGDGPWCAELAELSLGPVPATVGQATEGADVAAAQRFTAVCGGHAGPLAEALRAGSHGGTALQLLPEDGGLIAVVSGAAQLDIEQHGVDPLALWRTGAHHPLDTSLDAFLVAADQSWSLDLPEDRVVRVRLRPRGRAGVAALSVRASDHRATALVVPRPLEVQVVAQGETAAVAVLEGGRPATGARVRLQDGQGEEHEARVDASGVARLEIAPGPLRIAATKGTGVGYAVADAPFQAAWSPQSVAIVAADRAFVAHGAQHRFTVVAVDEGRARSRNLQLRSYASHGALAQRVPVEMVDGVGSVTAWVEGGGRVAVYDGEDEVASQTLGLPGRALGAVAVSFPSLPAGELGRVEVRLRRVAPPEGLRVRVELKGPTGLETTELRWTGGVIEIPVDLSAAAPRDTVRVKVVVAGEQDVGVSGTVEFRDAPGVPELPALAEVGAALPGPASGWWIAEELSGLGKRWIPAGEALRLPTAGRWEVRAWEDDRSSGSTSVTAVDAVLVDGRRQLAESTLVAVSRDEVESARIVPAGSEITLTGPGWVQDARGVHAHFRPARQPLAVEVGGSVGEGLSLGAELPEGTRLWAWLTDGSDYAAVPSHAGGQLDPRWAWNQGSAGLAVPWEALPVAAQRIAQALLEEEERLREDEDPQRLDFAFAAEKEMASGLGALGAGLGGGGTSGYGSGRSGYGMAGRRAAWAGPPGVSAAALAALESGAPGTWQVEVPSHVTAVWLRVLAVGPDGRVGWKVRRLQVRDGGDALPEPPAPVASVAWDGSSEALRDLALGLPIGARAHALAALVAAGDDGSAAPLAFLKSDSMEPAISPMVTASLRDGARPKGGSETALPDARVAARAAQSVRLLGADPGRATAQARRLLAGEHPLDPWSRTQAGLVLWLEGADDDEVAAALAGQAPALAIARAVVGAERGVSPDLLWTVASADGAVADLRALAVQALAMQKAGGAAILDEAGGGGELTVDLEAPWASWEGEHFRRGYRTAGKVGPLAAWSGPVPAHRVVSMTVILPALDEPSRIACSLDEETLNWREIAASDRATKVDCTVNSGDAGAHTLRVVRVSLDGAEMASTTLPFEVGPVASTRVDDPMSPDEAAAFGRVRALAGDADAAALLERLLQQERLVGSSVADLTSVLLEAAVVRGDTEAVRAAFDAYRERAPSGQLPLSTAAAVAHALAATGEPARAMAATGVVMDARFAEELRAFDALRTGGLDLTALKLLRELINRHPEGAAVARARFAAGTVLLERADGDGDRLGYTRSSLRHTAAAELAATLALHLEAPEAPVGAAVLLGALETLGDAERGARLAGPLAARFADTPVAWQLTLSDAHMRRLKGDSSGALRVLDGLGDLESQPAEVALERARNLELLGRIEDAVAALGLAQAQPEGQARLVRLTSGIRLETPVVQLGRDDPAVLPVRLVPGTQAVLSAYELSLESLALRDGGALDPNAVSVDGLGAVVRTVRADRSGALPLPMSGPGAWLMTVASEGETARALVLRSEAALLVDEGPGGGAMASVQRPGGAPVADAKVWSWAGGTVSAARTDRAGDAWLEQAPQYVLVKSGAGYTWSGHLEIIHRQRSVPRSYKNKQGAPSYQDLLKPAAAIEASAL